MNLLIIILIKALDLYMTFVLVSVVVNWLIFFEFLNIRNKWIKNFYAGINSFIEPPMALARRYIPPMGMLDLSPMVVIFAIYIIQSILISML